MDKIVSKILIVFIIFLFLNSTSNAITWKELKTSTGAIFSIDIDSIKDDGEYYYYNLQIPALKNKDFEIVTIQSAKKTPFSARIAFYSLSNYQNLQGDYQNITKNKTENLEAVTYESRVYSAYKFVKKYFQKTNIQIKVQ